MNRITTTTIAIAIALTGCTNVDTKIDAEHFNVTADLACLSDFVGKALGRPVAVKPHPPVAHGYSQGTIAQMCGWRAMGCWHGELSRTVIELDKRRLDAVDVFNAEYAKAVLHANGVEVESPEWHRVVDYTYNRSMARDLPLCHPGREDW